MRRHLGGQIEVVNASRKVGLVYGRRRQHDTGYPRAIPAGLLIEVLLGSRPTIRRPCVTGLLLGGPAGPQQILALWFADAQGNFSDLQFTDNAEPQAAQIIGDYCHRHGVDPHADERPRLFGQEDLIGLVHSEGMALSYPSTDAWLGLSHLIWYRSTAGAAGVLLIALVSVASVRIQEYARIKATRDEHRVALISTGAQIDSLLIQDLERTVRLSSIDTRALLDAARSVHRRGTRIAISTIDSRSRLEVYAIDSAPETPSAIPLPLRATLDLPDASAMPRIDGGLPRRVTTEGKVDAHLEYDLSSSDRSLPRRILLDRTRG